ncbi:MAG: CotH kinase family protein [Flavobacteriales bacterium]|nr:CotH kinase family protein [Flavobacteriales bacterium]MCB9364986.1 CotH kinase family protein [Flavobacteriales bacterium]
MKKNLLKGLLIGLISISTNLKSQDLYDLNNITSIQLTFWDANWDATMDTYYNNDNGERLLATAVINGITFDSVGVKYKGNSTYNSSNFKNPLNIDLEYTINQDYDGFTTLKLSNIGKDPSYVREVLSYKIGRQYMDMPLSNFATVTINGTYYGVYSSSESINSDYQKRYVHAGKNNTRFKCNPPAGAGPSATDLPTLEYLGTDSSDYFDSYELKSDFGWNDMPIFTNNLLNNTANLESFLDLDRAIWMLAFDNVMVNLDSYIGAFQQNYYLIKDDNNRMLPIIWDLNESIGGFTMISGGGGPGGGGVTSLTQMDLFLRDGDTQFPLVKAIFDNPSYKKMYVAHVKTIVEENITTNNYYTDGQALQALIDSDVQNEPSPFYSYSYFTSNLSSAVGTGPNAKYGISQILDGRRSYLQGLTTYNYVAPTISNITPPATVNSNSTITITAEVSNSPTYVYLGYRLTNPEVFQKVEMFDDGAHNDGSAGDGVFGADITIGASEVEYYIYAENSQAGMFSPERAEFEFYTLAVGSDVVINELSASNASIQIDDAGEYDDWIELYNNTMSPISLDGYYLSDDANDLMQWVFPVGTTINANDYLIIWADKDTLQTGLHANFKLSASGETIYLSDATGNLLDEITFANQTTDVTYGRYPNGTGSFMFMNPTFAAENSNLPIGVGVNEIQLEKNDFEVYPNPTNGILNIVFENNEDTEFEIYNLLGNRVYTSTTSGQQFQINVANWSKGIYLIKTKTTVEKIMVN